MTFPQYRLFLVYSLDLLHLSSWRLMDRFLTLGWLVSYQNCWLMCTKGKYSFCQYLLMWFTQIILKLYYVLSISISCIIWEYIGIYWCIDNSREVLVLNCRSVIISGSIASISFYLACISFLLLRWYDLIVEAGYPVSLLIS